MRLILFISLFFLACSQSSNKYGFEYEVNYDSTIQPDIQLNVNWDKARNCDWIFEDSLIICRLDNDTLKFESHVCMGPVIKLNINISEGHFNPLLTISNCTYSDKEEILRQHLTLNRSDYGVGDTITGKLYVENKKKTIISGTFRSLIRSVEFNSDSLRIENRRKKIRNQISNNNINPIRKLDLSKIRLSSFNIDFARLENLEELYLDENELDNFNFKQLSNLKKLRILHLNQCNLGKIPNEITKLIQLEELELWGNSLTKIPISLFNLEFLTQLNLGYNHIESIPMEIKNMQNIQSLDISLNPIYELPSTIYELKNMVELRPPSQYEKYSEVVNDKEFDSVVEKIKTDNNR